MNNFSWLLKREYWEHRGGFLWAPVWTGAVVLFLILCGALVGEVAGSRVHIHTGFDISQALHAISTEDLEQVGVALNGSLLVFASFVQIALAFVVFFYLLGALYDDRRDRSVLFWSSLPISATNTVASKVLAAAFVAPLIAFAVTVVMHIGILLALSLLVLLHGANPFTLIWLQVSPLRIWLQLLVLIPIGALWALPTYGWLLLCSAFARSKPFLWAVLPLVLGGWVLAMSGILNNDWVPRVWYWKNIFGRLLFSAVPGSWALQTPWRMFDVARDGPAALLNWQRFADVLATPQLWIGAVVGLAMLVAAAWLRRRRIETSV